nr:putative ribonuclease H-like domain-containing protein [Tanacetum cinerariifolium]
VKKDAASQEVKKDVSSLRYIALPNWVHDSLLESFSMETPILAVSSPVPTTCFTDSQEPSSDTRLISKRVANQVETLSLDNILTLTNRFEDILGVTINLVDSDGVKADEEGIDYDEVFAPVARIEAIRLFLSYASFMEFTVYQMDVKSAFIYGTINDEVYVMQPPGFQDPEFPGKVYKVEKAMYGLHQAPRAWYGTLSKYLLKNGFQRDSDYGGATQDRKSTTEGCQFLGRRLISRQCKKQTIVATSKNEAKYVAAASCCGQVLWIQNQLLDYGEVPVVETSKYQGVLRILMISFRLIPLQYGNFKAEGAETLEQTFNKLQAIISHMEFMDIEIE